MTPAGRSRDQLTSAHEGNTVTAEQVSALRTWLSGDVAEYERRVRDWDWVANRTGYTTLVSAAFVLAVERHFRPDHDLADVGDVLKYVADVRSRAADINDIDPFIAECLILPTAAGVNAEEIPVDAAHGTELMLLAALIADAQYDDTALDAFMTEARDLADDWTD